MPTPTPNIQIPKDVAQEIIDHLAMGTVPDEGLQFFTAGREKWIAALSEVLEQIRGNRLGTQERSDSVPGIRQPAAGNPRKVNGRIRIVKARYGDGKTHLMKVLRQQALSEG